MEIKPAMVAIAAFVVITVITAVLMPVLGDATKTEDTYTNDGYYRMNKISSDDSETYAFSWSSADAGVITINGVDSEISSYGISTDFALTIFATETDIFRLGIANSGLVASWIQIRGDTQRYAQATSSFEATIGSGSVSITMDTTNTYTLSYTDAYLLDPTNTGDYSMKKASQSAYMLDDSPIYAMGVTNVGGVSYLFTITGNVEGVTITDIGLANNAPTLTNSDIVISQTEVSDHIGLSKLDKITFISTPEGGTATNVTYSYFIVPHEVTAERSAHLTASENAILLVIPALVIIAILVGVLAVAFRGRE